MEITFQDLSKPLIQGLPTYFGVTPYIMYVESLTDKAIYIGWLNFAIVITKTT